MKTFKKAVRNVLTYTLPIFALAFLWKLTTTGDAYFAAEESFEIFLFALLGISVGEAAYRYQTQKAI